MCRSKGFKVNNCQSWRSQEKVCCPAPVPLKPVGPDLRLSAVESFLKSDGWFLCNPLIYRPQMLSIERSKPFKQGKRAFALSATRGF